MLIVVTDSRNYALIFLVNLTRQDSDSMTWIISASPYKNSALPVANTNDIVYILKPYQTLTKASNGRDTTDQVLTTLYLGYKAYETVLRKLCPENTEDCSNKHQQLQADMIKALQTAGVDFEQLRTNGVLPSFYARRNGKAMFENHKLVADPSQPEFSLYNHTGKVRPKLYTLL